MSQEATLSATEASEKRVANYENWVPLHMLVGLGAATGGFIAGTALAHRLRAPLPIRLCLGAAAAGCGAFTAWSAVARQYFSYDGKAQLARRIVEGTAAYVKLPEGGNCLDVGCGSGALTIAVAKSNPHAQVLGVDRWGFEYAPFSKKLCISNAQAEGVENVLFAQADAVKLPFASESFDAVTSNYVYHNIPGANKQALLRETLRVLKPGGTFAIHDIMTPLKYGNMQTFCDQLRAEGYQEVRLVPTDDGLFMSKGEAAGMMLTGSYLLVGVK